MNILDVDPPVDLVFFVDLIGHDLVNDWSVLASVSNVAAHFVVAIQGPSGFVSIPDASHELDGIVIGIR